MAWLWIRQISNSSAISVPADRGSWLIYALGGGWGHLTRSLALARHAMPQHPIQILCNSPYVDLILTSSYWQQNFSHHDLKIHVLSAMVSSEQAKSWVSEAMVRQKLDCLIVDTFPRGLVGELADCFKQIEDVPKIWVQRSLAPRYVDSFDIRSFVEQNYQLSLIPGDREPPVLADLGTRTAAWLSVSYPDLPARDQIRSLMGVHDEETIVVLVCASGTELELQVYGRLCLALARRFPQFAVRCLAATVPYGCPQERWIRHWPGIECLWGADLVVGGAGHNTVNECLALGVPLIAFPWRRLYDRQRLRIESAQHQSSSPLFLVNTIQEAIQAVDTYLQLPRRVPAGSYSNGADEAVRLIKRCSPNPSHSLYLENKS